MLADHSKAVLTVDLARQKVVWGDEEFAFEIDALKKNMLLEGLDEIGMTLARGEEITAFQQQDRTRRPWIYVQG
jgi:3-isopropylmalate/(R)-2-methylmalate dehydratase small subunit